ncbi:MAG: YicC/YloC family endoribonuclease [Planctomycetota bacterium]
MTGFGRAEGASEAFRLSVELRSVNHRNLAWKGRLPAWLQELEPDIDARLRRRLGRGSVHVGIDVEALERQTTVAIDGDLARSYLAQLDTLARDLGYEERPPLAYLLGMPGVVERQDRGPRAAEVRDLCLEVLDHALAELVAAREREGEATRTELHDRIARIEADVEALATRIPGVHEEYRLRLERRVLDFMAERGISAEKAEVLREVAIYADKSDVSEELNRLRTHAGELRRLLGQGGSVGRPIDFLVQEMLREIHTTGSKSADAELAHLVIDVKAELERIKEQAANLE